MPYCFTQRFVLYLAEVRLKNPEGDRLLYTVSHVADQLSVSTSKIYQLITRGELPSVMIDGSRRIPAEALKQFVADRAGKSKKTTKEEA